MNRPPVLLLVALGCLVILSHSGCALFSKGDERSDEADSGPLKQVRASADAMQLQVFFVERPKGDPLIGRSLWSEVDQISTFNPQSVVAARQNGMQFGVVGTTPPHSLQAALGMTTRATDSHREQIVGQTYTRRSGEELEITAWASYPECTIRLVRAEGEEERDYEQARCVFRVQVQRVQDGWARLELVPEIHHGAMQMRRLADEFSYTLRPSQLVDPLFDQRVTVELNLGEMVVIGADGGDPRSVGHHFFRGGETDNRLERLLVIRLADMRRIDPVY